MRNLIIGFVFFSIFLVDLFSKSERYDFVFLIHGLARSKKSMAGLGKFLEKNLYIVYNVSYPSKDKNIDDLAKIVYKQILSEQAKLKNLEKFRFHFVTHSMGGIIIRKIFAENEIRNLGSVVMLSPPNHGSEIVDSFDKLKLLKPVMGPASVQLNTSSKFLKSLPAPNFLLGIITGSVSLNPIYSVMINKKSDGKVSIESAKLKGMTDFKVVKSSHSFIMNNIDTRFEIIHFLRKGIFSKKIYYDKKATD